MSRIATIGMFDGVHRGHLSVINHLHTLNNSQLPPLVFTFTDHPLATLNPQKAPQLLSSASQKSELLRKADTEPILLEFNKEMSLMSAEEFLLFLHNKHSIDTLLMGFNNKFGHNPLSSSEYIELGKSLGIDVHIAEGINFDKDTYISSSAIRSALLTGNLSIANDMLGRNYSISGNVVNGLKIGRTIGFPTANILPELDRQLIPKSGVYACIVSIGREDDNKNINNKYYKAAVNIGYRPTIDNSQHPSLSIEANILDFEGNLYGKHLELSFIERLRDEQRFDSLELLKKALTKDIQLTRDLIAL